MQPLNYCRQIRLQEQNQLRAPGAAANHSLSREILGMCSAAQKFILPTNGIQLDNDELRGLSDGAPLWLPYPIIALEFLYQFADGLVPMVVFAAKSDKAVAVFVSWRLDGWWQTHPAVKLSPACIRRAGPGEAVAVEVVFANSPLDKVPKGIAVLVLLNVLNALSCKNIHIERVAPRKPAKKTKNALQFDTYHVLTVDVPDQIPGVGVAGGAGHRSPREHLRRGHIRRLTDGRRIWVNAAVVAAGRGVGIVAKDYAVRCAP